MDNSVDNINNNDPIKIICIDRNVPEPNLNFYCDDETLKLKKNYWKNEIKNVKKIVAPMVDQSELAFRTFMRNHGADLVFSPMIHAHLFVNDHTYRKTSLTTTKDELNSKFIVQFCANEPEVFLAACKYVEGYCSGVDLNLGCPQLIAKRGNYGAYLQEKRELIYEMINKVYRQCLLPISVKIRVQDTVEETINYAKMIEEAGASMITIHGRTREQRGVNTGIADWEHVAAVIKELNIPVIANGNIQLPGDVEKCLKVTNASAVMSAEGILFNPILFEDRFEPVFMVAREYMKYAIKYEANSSAVRAHIFRICHPLLLQQDDLRSKLSISVDSKGFIDIINELENRTKYTEESYQLAKKQFEEVDKSDLRFFVENTPNWFTKPYVRPLQVEGEKELSEYRINKKAEIDKLCETTGLSKRQIKKKEKRKREILRVKEARKTYPKCFKCTMPAGMTCQNICCKRCCRLLCLIEAKGCKSHKFTIEQFKAKREAFKAAEAQKQQAI